MKGKALVASDGQRGCVLFMSGAIAEMAAGGSSHLDEFGLDDAPWGVSIWEGSVRNERSSMGEDYEVAEGEYRDLTPEENEKLRRAQPPWEKAIRHVQGWDRGPADTEPPPAQGAES